MSPCACERSNCAWPASNVRRRHAGAWRRLLVRPSTALVLHLSRLTAHASCYPAGIGYTDAGGCVPDVASMAPQDFPLRDGPTVKAGNYPFKLDPLNISILAVILVVNAAFVACCLHIIWTRLCCPARRDPAASLAPAAADIPRAGVAGGGPGTENHASRAHIGMTAVVQPNDEVAIAVRVIPESDPIQAQDRQDATHAAAQSSDSASSVHTPTGMFKNPVFSIFDSPARRDMYHGPASSMI